MRGGIEVGRPPRKTHRTSESASTTFLIGIWPMHEQNGGSARSYPAGLVSLPPDHSPRRDRPRLHVYAGAALGMNVRSCR